MKIEDIQPGMLLFVPELERWLSVLYTEKFSAGGTNVYLMGDYGTTNWVTGFPGKTFRVKPGGLGVML